MKLKLVFLAFFILLIFFIFKNWILTPEIIGGDWIHQYPKNIAETQFIPPMWETIRNGGLGGIVPVYPLEFYLTSTIYVSSHVFHLPWEITAKIFWYVMFLVLSTISSIFLIGCIFPKSTYWQKLGAAFLYICNTYILMIVGGGQIGIGLAYALAPVVIGSFILLISTVAADSKNFFLHLLKYAVQAGLLLSLQVLFDIRLAYITLWAVGIYWVFSYLSQKQGIKKWVWSIVPIFIVPFVITILLHFFWILPLTIFKLNPLTAPGAPPISSGLAQFFSFGLFSQSFSLLHPNWPENIFGKSYFMRPEFIFIPLLAYASLLFINTPNNDQKSKIQNLIILFFVLLGLVGSFLAKGTVDPFGQLYIWLFMYIPGFNVFRDPTKFYILIALSYAVLVPFSVARICQWYNSKFKNQRFVSYIWITGVWFYFIFLLSPALLGQLGGTFREQKVPVDYQEFATWLTSQKQFSRTLWIPSFQRLGFYSNNHPAVNAPDLLNTSSSSAVLNKMHDPNSEQILKDSAIQYVVVPLDAQEEIFLKDRQYDDEQYKKIVTAVKKIPYLTQVKQFGKIVVFRTAQYNDHFTILGSDEKLSWSMINPAHYQIQAKNDTIAGQLIFSERFDQNWVAKTSLETIDSKPYRERFNSFTIHKLAKAINVYYKPQSVIPIGFWVSTTSLVGFLTLLFITNKKLKKI